MTMPALTSHIRYLLVVPFVLAMWGAQPADAFEIAIGHEQSPTYGVGIGISSLVKVKLLPEAGIDLRSVITTDDRASLEAMRNGSVAFAVVNIDGGQPPPSPDIRALATLGKSGSQATTLLARSDVDDASIQKILETIFSNVDFLKAIDSRLQDLDPDKAVMGLTLPLHRGAKRFYATWWGSPQSTAAAGTPEAAGAAIASEDRNAAAPAPTVSGGSADARNYVIYFGFDQATLNDAAEETLREAASFAATLSDPAMIVAAYTDSAGDAQYNYLLAERRAETVMQGLEALGVRYSRIDMSLFGERSPWSVTLDGVSEANNRRVELFIEEPVPELQPLPVSADASESFSTGTELRVPQGDAVRPPLSKPAGGPEKRILPSGATRRLM